MAGNGKSGGTRAGAVGKTGDGGRNIRGLDSKTEIHYPEILSGGRNTGADFK